MFKSIFKRLLTTYLMIICFIIITISITFSLFFSKYVVDQQHKILSSTANRVNNLVNSYLANEISKKDLDLNLDSLGYTIDARIFAVKANKEDFTKNKTFNLGDGLDEDFIINNMIKILDGQEIFIKSQYSKKFDDYVVFEGFPLKVHGKIYGAILIFSMENELSKNIRKMNIAILLITIILLSISTIVTFKTSKNISSPLKKMESAARKIAVGEKADDIEVNLNDEIASLAKSFNYMKNELILTEKMRREFIANVSHDLKTPLTSISGIVQAMIEGIVEINDYNKYLIIIQDETNRLIKITSEILEVAKIQSNSIKLFKEEIQLKPFLESLINSFAFKISEKELNMTLICPDNLIINADSGKLKQIIGNIISNSIKYNKKGGKIIINAIDIINSVEFVISDTGIGISDNEIHFIFEKFYRADKSRTSKAGGTGLGLSIAKSLVELHGGKISVSSTINQGTTLSIKIPK